MIWLQSDVASNVVGSISIACWIVVLVPQLWTNYKRKSSDSLSITFLLIWLFGDVLNLAGALLQDLLPTMIVLAFYYNLTDIILLVQVFYYRRYGRDAFTEDELVVTDEETPLVRRRRKPSQPEQISRSTFSHALEIMASVLCVCMTGAVAYYFSKNEEEGMHYEDDLSGAVNEYIVMNKFYWITGNFTRPTPFAALLGQTLGWGSAVLYLGSRIPQILKNCENRSCEGLSIVMFFFSVLGNATYCLSILFHSTKPDFILTHLPWLLGSGGTLIFDFMIFGQFYIYRNNPTRTYAPVFTSSRNSIIAIDDNESTKELSENVV